MHILFIVDDFKGGAGNVVQILGNKFADEGHKVTIMLFNKNSEPRYSLKPNVNLVDFKLNNIKAGNKILLLLKWIIKIRKKIKSLQPDVVLSFLTNNNALTGVSLLATTIPFIASERSDPIRIQPKFTWRILRDIAYSRANKITVQCSNFAQFCNGKYLSKTIIMPNPILAPTIRKTSLPSISEALEIVSLGRLHPVKGFDLLIEAFSIVHEKYPKTKLKIIGEGPQRENLKTRVKDYGLTSFVELVGHSSNVYSDLASADIYVMSSRHEGFPNALGEAMAVGLPVVAFKCHDGIKDLINNNKNGILVSQNNVDLLAREILKLIENPDLRFQLGNNAVKIINDFSLERTYKLWYKAITQELNIRPRKE